LAEGSLAVVLNRLGKIRGIRERQAQLDRLLSYTGAMEVIHEDFLSKGVIYNLLMESGALVYKGDDNIKVFCKNRLEFLMYDGASKSECVGFILGPEYHHYDGKWLIQTLSIKQKHEGDDLIGIYSPGSKVAPGRWQMHFKIKSKQKDKPDDGRKILHGMACLSLSEDILAAHAKALGIEGGAKKTKLCKQVEIALLGKQLSSSTRCIFSPFDQ
jgi:hypothetical protein